MGVAAVDLGRMRHYVRLEAPSATTADAYGGYSQTWSALNPPDAHCSVKVARLRTGERQMSNTAVAQAMYEVLMRWHPQVTTETRVRWTDQAGTARTLSVVDVENVDEMGAFMRLTCVEVTAS